MNKFIATKLLVVAATAMRRFCEQSDIDFVTIIVKSAKSDMTIEEIENYIDNFDEAKEIAKLEEN